MYDRAPRSLIHTVGCTPENVGPGSYHHRRKQIAEGLFIVHNQCFVFYQYKI
jgi:hypothetical protein